MAMNQEERGVAYRYYVENAAAHPAVGRATGQGQLFPLVYAILGVSEDGVGSTRVLVGR